eukprot:TRINITY_DN156_c0_g1_i2.p1 TRINITY_DN156_c0_g1~~TRINITY_DN156_c0_g1_i2.p1  ORF type:complete len:285 (-),score=88.70 TRINITY_DN156_c0_g1_i2:26-880(-)
MQDREVKRHKLNVDLLIGGSTHLPIVVGGEPTATTTTTTTATADDVRAFFDPEDTFLLDKSSTDTLQIPYDERALEWEELNTACHSLFGRDPSYVPPSEDQCHDQLELLTRLSVFAWCQEDSFSKLAKRWLGSTNSEVEDYEEENEEKEDKEEKGEKEEKEEKEENEEKEDKEEKGEKEEKEEKEENEEKEDKEEKEEKEEEEEEKEEKQTKGKQVGFNDRESAEIPLWVVRGARVEVFWKHDSKWYPGVVESVAKNQPGFFWVKYDDGDREKHEYDDRKWRLI